MKKNYARTVALALGILASTIALAADSLPGPDWIDVPVLESRLVARMPPEAKASAYSPGVMSGPQSTAQQQRVMMDIGAIRIVLLVTELFRVSESVQSASAAIAKEMREALKIADPKVTTLPAADESVAVAFLEPEHFVPAGDSRFVAAAVIRQRDGTLQRILFYTNAAGAEAPDKVRLIALAIASSVKTGTRTLQSGGRFTDPDSPFQFEVPQGYTFYHQRSYDFTVDRVVRLVDIAAPGSMLGIYVGHHPQKRSAPADAKTMDSSPFGSTAQWWLWTSDGRAHAENYFSDLGTGKLAGQAFINAATEADRDALLKILSVSKVR